MNLSTRIRRAWKAFTSTRGDGSVFAGAQNNRLTLDWVASILSADQEIRGNFLRLRARGRELSRNNPIAKNYLNLLTANVIGPRGIRYQAQVKNADGKLNTRLNEKIESAFCEWCEMGNCTVDGKLSLRGLADQVLRNVAADGEVFMRMVPAFKNKYRFALQTIDADQVDSQFNRYPDESGTTEIRMGVEVDSWGKPVAYWVSPYRPYYQFGIPGLRGERISAEYVRHLYDPLRMNQTRGITWFHAVMFELRMLGGYIEAELVAARTGAAKMGWLQYTDPSAFVQPTDEENAAVPKTYTLDANPGVVETLPPGMDFKEWSPDHPANAFSAFVITLLRQVATGLGVSYNALASDLVGVNYSSMRSGMLIDRDHWRKLQQWMIENFYQPIFENWLSMALLSGDLVLDSRDPTAFLAGKWEPRGWQWVDPLKDMEASAQAIAWGLTSREAVLAEQGKDLEETFEQLQTEQEMADELNIPVNGETLQNKPVPVPKDTEGPDDATATETEDATTTTKKGRNRTHVLNSRRRLSNAAD